MRQFRTYLLRGIAGPIILNRAERTEGGGGMGPVPAAAPAELAEGAAGTLGHDASAQAPVVSTGEAEPIRFRGDQGRDFSRLTFNTPPPVLIRRRKAEPIGDHEGGRHVRNIATPAELRGSAQGA